MLRRNRNEIEEEKKTKDSGDVYKIEINKN